VGPARLIFHNLAPPNVDAENAYIIETYGGVELINYAKEANLTVVASNTLFKSLRNTPFIELLYPNGTATANGTFYVRERAPPPPSCHI
jgi:hypothetical protein